jgi:hypothetical protein
MATQPLSDHEAAASHGAFATPQQTSETTRQAAATRAAPRAALRTPKAAAIAGVLFSVLLIAILVLVRSAVPADPREPGAWLRTDLARVETAFNLLPFAAIAFLWFVGFLRHRLGQHEDRFFATMFLGSGLLLLAMMFTLAALVGGIVIAHSMQPEAAADSPAFRIARATTYGIAHVYMTKMAAIFTFATARVCHHIGIGPRWVAFVGYALAFWLLFGSPYLAWSFMGFPLWTLLLSVCLMRTGEPGFSR